MQKFADGYPIVVDGLQICFGDFRSIVWQLYNVILAFFPLAYLDYVAVALNRRGVLLKCFGEEW